ncbi:MAG: HIT family protein [Gammaproteobacteria bacterium]
MSKFELDLRLATDCLTLGENDTSLLLLMDNALLPWFIIVPKTSKIEFIDLTESEQKQIQKEINLMGAYIMSNFKVSKLNIATIGNIVNQLHIHVVGRDPSDFCWPNVVWGTTKKTPYSEGQIAKIIETLKKQLNDAYKFHPNIYDF